MSRPVWRCQYAKGYYLIAAPTPEAAVRRIQMRNYAETPPLLVAPYLPLRWPQTETSRESRDRHAKAAVRPQEARRRHDLLSGNREAA